MKYPIPVLISMLAIVMGMPAWGEPLPIDPLWQSAEFRKVFTASYGVDARIEPRLSTEEKAVLDAVAEAMADGDREAAIASLTDSSLLGDSAALIFNLGNLRFEEGQLDDAIENFSKAVERYPNFRDAHRNLAVAQIQAGDFAAAEPHLSRAIELGASDGVTFGLLGYSHAMAGRHQPALQAYRLAQMTMPEEAQWQIGEAQALSALGDLAAAGSLFDALLQRRPMEVGLWLRQADVWIRSTEPERAIANLEFAHRLDPLAAKDLAALGHLYVDQNLAAMALRCYLEAADGVVTEADAGNETDTDAGDETEDAAVDRDGLTAVLAGLDRLCGYRHYTEARSLAERLASFELDEEAMARVERALALIELESESGDSEVGVARVEAILERDPLDGEALLLLARHHERRADAEHAMLLLERAAKVDATRAEALLRHGRLLVAAREYAEGLALIEQSLALQPRPGIDAWVETVRGFAEGETDR